MLVDDLYLTSCAHAYAHKQNSLVNQTQLSAAQLDVLRHQHAERGSGMGTLAVRPLECSHMTLSRAKIYATSTRDIQICACVVCALIPAPALNMLPCGECDGSHATAVI